MLEENEPLHIQCGNIKITVTGKGSAALLARLFPVEPARQPEPVRPPVGQLPADNWLNASQVAAVFGVTRPLINVWVEKGYLPAPTVQWDKSRKWSRTDIAAIISNPPAVGPVGERLRRAALATGGAV